MRLAAYFKWDKIVGSGMNEIHYTVVEAHY
jgi:hypothetical protein